MTSHEDNRRRSDSLRRALDHAPTVEHRARLADLARRRNEAVHSYDSTALELIQLAAEAHADGLSITEIADVLGVSRPTIYAWLDRARDVTTDDQLPSHVRGGPRTTNGWRFDIVQDSAGHFLWRLVAPNQQFVVQSEVFADRTSAFRAVEAVRRNAAAAEIYEQRLVRPARNTEAMAGNRRTVSPSPEGGWDVNKPGASRASSHHDTQADAQSAARRYLGNEGGGELVTQGRDGKIRDKDTVRPGNDPYPPKG